MGIPFFTDQDGVIRLSEERRDADGDCPGIPGWIRNPYRYRGHVVQFGLATSKFVNMLGNEQK